ncbi:hypothetical protein, partial [Neorhizobium galegae]|uniref:hypothetical protein n=1 Tax=Neorhizobium galegae TaxID=399 RepID=UPI0006211815
LVKPKVYNARALVGAAFEERLWISRDEAVLAPIEVSSASLRNMRFRINSETHFRVYVVTRDIKLHPSDQNHIERLFDEFILETWNDYPKKGSSKK